MSQRTVSLARPWPSIGIGWLIAIIVLILAVLNVIGGTKVPDIYLILGLALAILL